MAEELDYKSVLREALNLLLEDLDPLPILDYFIQHEFLTPMRIRDIQEIGTTTAKNREIVKSLGAKGLKGYRKFKRFLRDSCQGHLADCLEKIEEKVKAEQRLKPRGNTTMQPDGLNAGRNRDRNSNGANSRGLTINQGGQYGLNFFGGTFNNHGTINLGPGIGGNGAMQGDRLNRGLNKDGNLGGNGAMQGDRLNRGLNTDGNLGGNGAMQGDRLNRVLNTDGNLGGNGAMHGDRLNTGLNTDGNLGQGQPNSNPGFQNLHGLVNQPSSYISRNFPQNNDSYDGRNQSGQPGSDVSQSYDAEHVTGATGTQQSSEILYRRESASLQQGANREGDDMIDAAPVEQMEELQIGPFSPAIVHKTETDFQDKADGRMLVVDEKYLEEVIVESDELQSGSTGKVFRCIPKLNDPSRRSTIKHALYIILVLYTYLREAFLHIAAKKIKEEWGFRIVIKKIQRKGSKLQSVVNEVVAARMKHQGIVPLLAKTNYKDKDHAYFVFPFMENGDLMNAIREDMNRKSKEEEVHMGARQRVLILYQIACAMCFIHTPVKDLRGAVFHGDVTTKNIVLDEKYNARLLDFGVARELEFEESSIQSKTGDPIGTPGYITVLSKVELSPKSDCTNFGVVILELLTGEVPKKKDRELRKEFLDLSEEEFNTIHEECYESVWKKFHSVYDKLKNLAGKCLKKETDSKSLARSLYEILSDDFNFNWEGESGETTMQSSVGETEKSKKKCSLCIINWAVDDFQNLRLDGCVAKKEHISPPVCVACMRNSYLNPIMCVRCRGTIQTNIGNSWGAILVEGSAMNKDGVAFKNDVRSMDRILTSKYPLVFGLDPDNVISTTMEELSDAVDRLKEKACIATVMVYYSGHYNKEKGFTINRDSYWEVERFSEVLDRIEHEIILVLDCCEAGSIKVGSRNIILRLNSSKQDDVSRFNEYDSTFTKFFIQATNTYQCTEQCQICKEYKPDSIQKGFISPEPFCYYIKKHISDYCKTQCVTFEPTFTGKKETDSHFYIGYFVAGKQEIRFDLEKGNDHITIKNWLCEMSELRNLLLEKIVENILRKRSIQKFKDYWKDNEKSWQEFSSAIRVRITKGPHSEHTSELITIQQVVDAWDKMFELEFGFRDIHNIEKGKVVVDLEDMDTQEVIDLFRTIKDRDKDCLELVTLETIPFEGYEVKVDEKTKVTIPNCTFGEQKRHTDVQVPKWLEKIIIRKKLKKAEKLIITIWPELGKERLLMEIPRTTTV